jgi:uncharacterized membrane protein
VTDPGNSVIATAALWAMEGLEAAGIAVIVAGAIISTALLLRDALRGDAGGAYTRYRRRFGRALLVGLELLVAADIIGTVVAPLDLGTVAALGLVVIIRTMLSLSIEVEINGRWPWRMGRADR